MTLAQGLEMTLSWLGGNWQDWLGAKAATLSGGLGDYVFFDAVMDRIQYEIRELQEGMLDRMGDFVLAIGFSVMTLWVMWKGYLAITGQLRENMAALLLNTTKAVMIVTVAGLFTMGGAELDTFLTRDLQNEIYELVSGEGGTPEEAIDSNLGWMQVALSSIDALDTAGDQDAGAQKDRAMTMIGLGAGGPPLIAGALYLMYRMAIALFIGLGPIFILCLLFDYTKSLFQKWLFYGIATMFSMALLAVMTSIALGIMRDVAIAMWSTSAISSIVFQSGDTVSYSSRALQQGGLGTILTLLLLTVPPMAGNFFSATLGSFMQYSVFGGGGGQDYMAQQARGGGGGAALGPQGQPPGAYQTPPQGVDRGQTGQGATGTAAAFGNQVTTPYTGGNPQVAQQGAGLRGNAPPAGGGSGTAATQYSGTAATGGTSAAGPGSLARASGGAGAEVPPELQRSPQFYGPGAQGAGSSTAQPPGATPPGTPPRRDT